MNYYVIDFQVRSMFKKVKSKTWIYNHYRLNENVTLIFILKCSTPFYVSIYPYWFHLAVLPPKYGENDTNPFINAAMHLSYVVNNFISQWPSSMSSQPLTTARLNSDLFLLTYPLRLLNVEPLKVALFYSFDLVVSSSMCFSPTRAWCIKTFNFQSS